MSTESNSAVLDFLREDPGTGYTIASIASNIGVGVSAVRASCAELLAQRLIRESTAARCKRYIAPDEQMLAIERRLAEKVSTFTPLRRRTDHADAVARARASKLK